MKHVSVKLYSSYLNEIFQISTSKSKDNAFYMDVPVGRYMGSNVLFGYLSIGIWELVVCATNIEKTIGESRSRADIF